jgi:hypothetical protein
VAPVLSLVVIARATFSVFPQRDSWITSARIISPL